MDEFSERDFVEESPESSGQVAWRASEFEYHHKKFGWYLMLALGVGALSAVAVLIKQWMTIAVLAVMGAALMVYANRKPRELDYSIDERGVSIGDKLYPFSQFESFSIIEDANSSMLDLDPVKRFAPRVSLALEDGHEEEVAKALAVHLPLIDREPDLIERVTRRLKF